MTVDKALTQQLEEIITSGLAEIPLPYQKGNSIRLKHIAIRKHKNGYKMFDCKTNSHIQTTFTKTAALAIAKNIVEEKSTKNLEHITMLDNKVAKHYMDALFAKRSYENSNDFDKKEHAEIIFDVAMDKAWLSLEAIEQYIFDK